MSRSDSVVSLVKADDLDADFSMAPHRAKHLVFIGRTSGDLLALLDRVAPSDAPILIAGETGTGKELVARHVHRKSNRSGPFLAVNCGAISEHLAESELFGHEAGSFTGASSRREGWFEAAHGGTLFLDEIGDMPLAMQGKLLRVLQEGEVTRIGARKPTPIDVRIVSASNVDLEAAVENGSFRRDLFYRLNIVPVVLPALRDRPEDLAALAGHFAAVYGARLKRNSLKFSAAALEKLARHTWPGNIRELEGVVHYAMLIAPDAEIGPEHIRITAQSASKRTAGPTGARPDATPLDRLSKAMRECFDMPGTGLFRDVERRLVEEAFRRCDSNQVRAAELLGVSRNVVRTLLKRYGFIADAEAHSADIADFVAASPDLSTSLSL
jgi:DNA-binding NtrC family response regulator